MKSPLNRLIRCIVAANILSALAIFATMMCIQFTDHDQEMYMLIPATVIVSLICTLIAAVLAFTWRNEIDFTKRLKRTTTSTTVIVATLIIAGIYFQQLLLVFIMPLLPTILVCAWAKTVKQSRYIEIAEEVSLRCHGPILTRLTLASLLWLLPLIAAILDDIYIKSWLPERLISLFIKLSPLYISVMWFVIWPGLVSWTRPKAILTAAAYAINIFLAVMIYNRPNDYLVLLLPLTTAMIISTAFIWRIGRKQRLNDINDADRYKNFNETLYCPECGFNLRGLPHTKCPECGRQYTLMQLVYENVRMRDLDMQMHL